MIDEELYKRATEELDSSDRKKDVWARACALASDDHDEARFLYTNLRVEEMLNTDGKQRTFSTSRHRRDNDLSSADKLDSLDLSVDDDSPVSHRSGLSTDATPLPTLEASEQRSSSVAGTQTMSNEIVAFDDETMAELDSLSRKNDNTEFALSGITGSQINPSVVREPDSSDIISEVIDSPNERVDAKVLSPEEKRTTELAHKLERQAESMAYSDDSVDALPKLESATADLESVNELTSEIRNDYADSTILDDDVTLEFDADDNVGGRAFMVFSRHGVIKAIKRGVSWPALFFTFPWLLSKALIGTAIVYGFLWLVTLAGLYTAGTGWLDAGDQASLGIKLWTAAFAALAIIGLLYIPFRYGNRWVAEKLQNRGFQFEASINAGSKREAVNRLMETNP